jgi:hypothetical protein
MKLPIEPSYAYKVAQRLIHRYHQREDRNDSRAERKLMVEIAIALMDAAVGCPIIPAEDVYPQAEPSLVEIAMRKLVEGKPLSKTEENDILFGGL